MARPIPNCYRVPESQIFAGEYPGDLDPARARQKIRALLGAGVDLFIDLTEESELDPYQPILTEEAERLGLSVSHVRHPIRDLRVPTVDEMHRLLRVLSDAEEREKCAYVHCWGGVGRTGTVIACHLAELGYSAQKALDTVRKLFGEMSPRKLRAHPWGSPETEAQREFVLKWNPRPPKAEEASPPSGAARNNISPHEWGCPEC